MSVCTSVCLTEMWCVGGGSLMFPISFSLVLGRAGLQCIRAKLGRQKITF